MEKDYIEIELKDYASLLLAFRLAAEELAKYGKKDTGDWMIHLREKANEPDRLGQFISGKKHHAD